MIVRASKLAAVPWPNGQGLTRDVAESRLPDGSRDWLISIADLSADADFSHFERCDRFFTLLGGEGVELTVGSAPPLRCLPLVPVYFAGDLPARCHVPHPTRAFNLFSTRGGTPLEVSARMIAGGHRLELTQRLLALHCALGEVRIAGQPLRSGDTDVGVEPHGIVASKEGACVIIVQAAAG